MFFLYIGLVAATFAVPSKPMQQQLHENGLEQQILGKRKGRDMDVHFERAARETHYSDSLFIREELDEIDREFNPSRTTLAPSVVDGWARERFMLLEYLQSNPRGSVEPLLESIHAQFPDSGITLEMLQRDRANTLRVAVVPTWFHEAMMSLEPLTTSFDYDSIPWLLSQAPAGSSSFRRSEVEIQAAARIWFEYCLKPTRMNHPGGPWCVPTQNPALYAFTHSQLNRYLDHFKQVISRYT